MGEHFRTLRQEEVEAFVEFMKPDIVRALMLGYSCEIERSRNRVKMTYYRKHIPDPVKGVR